MKSPKVARARMSRRERWLAYGLLAPALGAVALLVAWPLWVILQMSLRPGKSLELSRLLTQPLGLANFERVLGHAACSRGNVGRPTLGVRTSERGGQQVSTNPGRGGGSSRGILEKSRALAIA